MISIVSIIFVVILEVVPIIRTSNIYMFAKKNNILLIEYNFSLPYIKYQT